MPLVRTEFTERTYLEVQLRLEERSGRQVLMDLHLRPCLDVKSLMIPSHYICRRPTKQHLISGETAILPLLDHRCLDGPNLCSGYISGGSHGLISPKVAIASLQQLVLEGAPKTMLAQISKLLFWVGPMQKVGPRQLAA